MIVTLNHACSIPMPEGKYGYCIPGLRLFFKRHGMDFRTFARNGLPEEDFLKTGDAMALKLVEFARGQQ